MYVCLLIHNKNRGRIRQVAVVYYTMLRDAMHICTYVYIHIYIISIIVIIIIISSSSSIVSSSINSSIINIIIITSSKTYIHRDV